MVYQSPAKPDRLHTGRMILSGMTGAFLITWILEFLTYPTFLIPAFLYDRTYETAFNLIELLLQFGFISLLLILLWAGINWVRYVMGVLLLGLGMINLVQAVALDALGAVQLILGALCLVGAAASVLSLSLEVYMKDRRSRGIAWLPLGLAVLALPLIVLSVCAVQGVQAYEFVQDNLRASTFASQVMAEFAPNLDPTVIDHSATEDYREKEVTNHFPEDCKAYREAAGEMQKFSPPQPPNIKEALGSGKHVLDVFSGKAQYAHGSMVFTVSINPTTIPMRVTEINFLYYPDSEKEIKNRNNGS